MGLLTRKWTKLFSVVFLSLFYASSLSAQDYPEYDGVYIFSASGEWVEIPRTKLEMRSMPSMMEGFSTKPHKWQAGIHRYLSGYLALGIGPEQYYQLPVIDTSQGLRIFVKSRTPSMNFLGRLIHLEGPELASNQTYGEDLSDIVFVEAGTGWGSDSFKIKSIDQFSTEYVGASLPISRIEPSFGFCRECNFIPLALSVEIEGTDNPSNFEIYRYIFVPKSIQEIAIGEGYGG